MAQHSDTYRDSIAQLTAPGAPFELETRGDMRRYKNAPANLRDAMDTGRQHGDAEFVVYEGERWSFNKLFTEADALSAALLASGVAHGDRIAIAMRNYPEWLAAFIGVIGTGATVVPLNSWGTASDIVFGLNDSGTNRVICDAQRYEGMLAQGHPLSDTAIVVRTTDIDQSLSWDSLLAPHRGCERPQVAIDGDNAAMIMYTSGTSGKPKGALSTHDAISQGIFNLECAAIAAAMCNGDTFAAMFERGFAPAALLAIPLFHVSGCHSQFLTCLRGGRRLIMMYKWDSNRALELIETERATTIAAAPAMLIDLLESPNFDRTDTSSLFALAAGGAATPPLVKKLMKEKVPGYFFGTGWGMTESNAQGVSIAGALVDEKTGSSGYPHPIVDLDIRDDQGASLPVGETGAIWLRSPTLIREYWNRPEANKADFSHSWYCSGDLGYLDEDGYLYLAARSKDMIIRGGENIYPVEIEHVFLELPQVQEVAVVGLPDERMGELVVAILRFHEGQTIAEDALQAHAKATLAAYKRPSKIIIRTEPMPRNVTEKILKHELRDELLAG